MAARHKNIKILPWAYQVVFVRDKTEYSRSFKFSVGKRKALNAAKKYRDHLTKALPMIDPFRTVPLSNTGVVGVSRCRHTDRRKREHNVYIQYSAHYIDDQNKPNNKSFWVGNENTINEAIDTAALNRAIQFRKQWETDVLKQLNITTKQ